MLQSIKKNLKHYYYEALIFAAFIYTTIYQILFFKLELSSDFDYYRSYLDTFYQLQNYSELEQGLSYHFLVSIFLSFSSDYINSQNINFYISNSIHIVNNFLFMISLIGVRRLLNFYKISKDNINFLTIFIIFLPFVTHARFHYKPEIFAIALFPWLILSIEKYLKYSKLQDLISGITILALTLLLKGNIFGMLGIFITLIFIKNFKLFNKKHITIGLIYLCLICSFVILENIQFNQTNLFENTNKRTESENYNNIADKSFFTAFDYSKFIRNPKLDPENINFFSIVLVDTFNDYFGVSWNIDHFPMSKDYFFFENWILNGLFNYLEYYLAVLFSLIFYIGVVISVFNKKIEAFERIVIGMPLIGLCLLLINSFGIPFPNFDPNKGDTFKSIYLSFLLLMTMVYLIKNYILKWKFYKYILLFLLIVYNLFSLGFNLEAFKNDKFISQTNEIIDSTPFCEPINLALFSFFDSNCNNLTDVCSEPKPGIGYTKKKLNPDGSYTFFSDGGFKEIYLKNFETGEVVLVTGFDQCYFFQENDFKNPYQFQNIKYPFINIVLILVAFLGLFKLTKN